MSLKDQFHKYSKTLTNVISDNYLAAEYIDELELKLSLQGEELEDSIEKAEKSPKGEKHHKEPRPGYFKFQTEIMDYHDKAWSKMMKDLEKDIEKVINGTN